jgi:hypothetical protein
LAALLGRGPGLDRKPRDSLNFTHRVVGGHDQLQSSASLSNWSNYGTPFVATVANAPQYVAVTNTEMYFRVLAVP